MKVRAPDGRVFAGTPTQIVGQMRDLEFGGGLPLRSYVREVAARVERTEGVRLAVGGGSDEEVAGALVTGLLEAGLLHRA